MGVLSLMLSCEAVNDVPVWVVHCREKSSEGCGETIHEAFADLWNKLDGAPGPVVEFVHNWSRAEPGMYRITLTGDDKNLAAHSGDILGLSIAGTPEAMKSKLPDMVADILAAQGGFNRHT